MRQVLRSFRCQRDRSFGSGKGEFDDEFGADLGITADLNLATVGVDDLSDLHIV